ncbi:MAG: hypothetical protein JW726_13420 [Anaerolineales bacterium]|nr:hypothetical protein [Anaerolineales bacterium]
MLQLAQQYDRSAYNAVYLSLAKETGQTLLTGDLRLFNAAHADLDWVVWIEDYPVGEML